MKLNSKKVVKAWARLSRAPRKTLGLKKLWASSGDPQAADWDAGAAKLAELMRPHLRPGQVVTQSTIQGLDPNTVGQLVDQLQMSSSQIVKAWANLASLPTGQDDLKALWAGSGDPLAADWNAGAAKLAQYLHPDLRPGQVVDQAFIQALNPSNVGQLAQQLGW